MAAQRVAKLPRREAEPSDHSTPTLFPSSSPSLRSFPNSSLPPSWGEVRRGVEGRERAQRQSVCPPPLPSLPPARRSRDLSILFAYLTPLRLAGRTEVRTRLRTRSHFSRALSLKPRRTSTPLSCPAKFPSASPLSKPQCTPSSFVRVLDSDGVETLDICGLWHPSASCDSFRAQRLWRAVGSFGFSLDAGLRDGQPHSARIGGLTICPCLLTLCSEDLVNA